MTGPLGGPRVTILVVCSANRCRSPMAAALLRRRLGAQAGQGKVEVRSAGFGPPGLPVIQGAARASADAGLDIREHRSRQVVAACAAESNLIIGMTRQHVIDLVLLSSATWPRTFSLADLVRRGRQAGPRTASEDLDAWVARLHGGRSHSSVLALPATDDIADPLGSGRTAFDDTRRDLTALVDQLVDLLTPPIMHTTTSRRRG